MNRPGIVYTQGQHQIYQCGQVCKQMTKNQTDNFMEIDNSPYKKHIKINRAAGMDSPVMQ